MELPLAQTALDEKSPVPLYEQLARELRRLIASRQLTAGEQLPSVQKISTQLQVSTSTVRQAISQLTTDGWLISQQGSRPRVATQLPVIAPVASSSVDAVTTEEQQAQKKSDFDNLSKSLFLEFDDEDEITENSPTLSNWGEEMSSAFARTNFHARYDEAVEIDFRVGAPPAKILGGSGWQDALTRWSRRCIEIPRGHNNPAGLLELRQQIAKWLRQQRHLECDEENIFILSGAQQARNLICRLFVDQNTPVAFEEPGSLFARLCLESYGATIIPIHVDGSGLVTSELTQCIKPIPKILYLTPSAQFPTGAILSRSRRTQVAKWAQENNSLIIEDDNNCEFTYDSRQSAAVFSFAPERTIYIGTFSQLLEPSWRVSYLVLPRSLREPFYRLKWLSDRCSSPLVQELVLELMESGFLRRHLKKAQKSCEQRREIMLKELEKFPADLIQYSPTKGGLHQAVWFPSRVNDIEIFARCFEKNVGVLPLSPYFAGSPAAPGILLNFSSLDAAQMKEGMNRIATILEEAYGS